MKFFKSVVERITTAAIIGLGLGLLSAFLDGNLAFADSSAPAPVYQSWFPQGNTTLAPTGTTSNVALPAAGQVAIISNVGSADAFFALGTANTVTATTSSYRVTAGRCVVVSLNIYGTLYTYLAAITGGTTGSLYIETGTGSPPSACPGVDNGGGAAQPISPSSLPVTGLSGTITTGGTFQTLSAAASRNSFEFENICNVAAAGACVATTDNCYLNFLSSGATKATSILVVPGAYYGRTGVTTPSSLITVTCDGTGDAFWSQKQ